MSTLRNSLAALALAGASVGALALPAHAATTPVAGVGVASMDAIVANSNAFKTAETQRPVTYKAQLDQAQARANAIQAQLKPLYDKFQADQRAASPNQASLQQQAATIQQLQQSGQAEIDRILQPVALSRAYVIEQIEDKLEAAVKSAMKKQNVGIVLQQDATVAFEPGQNLNQAILNELNATLPSAQLVPPAGWLPRAQREQQAAAAAQQAPAAAPATGSAPKAPTGR